ncbi:hypothetical protein QFZ64_005591 [Streptomyces sp. B3I8]|nr:hypothetical protein [Streptomyces sp. B3I8]
MRWILIYLTTGVIFPVHRPSRGAPRSLSRNVRSSLVIFATPNASSSIP